MFRLLLILFSCLALSFGIAIPNEQENSEELDYVMDSSSDSDESADQSTSPGEEISHVAGVGYAMDGIVLGEGYPPGTIDAYNALKGLAAWNGIGVEDDYATSASGPTPGSYYHAGVIPNKNSDNGKPDVGFTQTYLYNGNGRTPYSPMFVPIRGKVRLDYDQSAILYRPRPEKVQLKTFVPPAQPLQYQSIQTSNAILPAHPTPIFYHSSTPEKVQLKSHVPSAQLLPYQSLYPIQTPNAILPGYAHPVLAGYIIQQI